MVRQDAKAGPPLVVGVHFHGVPPATDSGKRWIQPPIGPAPGGGAKPVTVQEGAVLPRHPVSAAAHRGGRAGGLL
jgi:hypothetical protein